MKLKEGIEINEDNLEFKLDSEFVNLCNSLLDEEFEKLENSIKNEGCRDPLVIWKEKDILIDGHHRLFFCQKHNQSYQIVKKSFSDRFTALLWEWTNDKGRRGSGDSPYYDCETVILKFKDGLEKRAKKNLRMPTGSKQAVTLPHGAKSIDVREELANLAHYSHNTVHRTEFIIKYGDEETKEGLRKRKSKIKFRALAEKLMMLYPEKQDSKEELEFKESLDKETILNTLNLPQSQSFVKAVKEVKGITSEQQIRVAKKLKEDNISDKESMKFELMEEKYKYTKKEKKEKKFEDFLGDVTKKIRSLNEDLKTVLVYKNDIDPNVYKDCLVEFLLALKFLINNTDKFKNGGKNNYK